MFSSLFISQLASIHLSHVTVYSVRPTRYSSLTRDERKGYDPASSTVSLPSFGSRRFRLCACLQGHGISGGALCVSLAFRADLPTGFVAAVNLECAMERTILYQAEFGVEALVWSTTSLRTEGGRGNC